MTENFSRLIVHRGAFVIIIRGIAALLNISYFIYLAKILPIQDYGLFMLCFSLSVFFLVFCQQGCERLIIKLCGASHDIVGRNYYVMANIYFGLTSLCIAVVITLLADVIADKIFDIASLAGLLKWLSILLVSTTLNTINSSVLKGRGYPVSGSLVSGLPQSILCLVVTIISQPDTALAAFKIYVLANVIMLIISYITVLMLGLNKYEATKTIPLKSLWPNNVNFFLIAMGGMLTLQLGSLFLGVFNYLEEIAIFALAVKFTFILRILLRSVNIITAPKYAKFYSEGDMHSFWAMYKESQRILIISGCSVVAAVMLFAPFIVDYLGQEYTAFNGLLAIILVGQLVNVCTGSVVNILVMTDNDHIHRRNILFLSLVHIILLLLFVPQYGMIAAAWILSAMLISNNLISYYYVHRLIPKPQQTV